MSAAAELTERLIAGGMSPAEAGALLARAAVEMNLTSPTKAALRTRRWREKRASQTVTNRHAVTPENGEAEPSPTVTERHKASPRDGTTISKERKIRAPASRLADDWKPSEKDIAYAISKGVSLARVEVVAEKFKNHWLSKSKNATSPNWHLRWCTWVMNEIEWSANRGGARNGQLLPRNPLFEGIT